MASIKIILKNKANKHNKYPLYVQIIKDRKKSLMSTGHYVEKDQWDSVKQHVRKSNPEAQTINTSLRDKLANASKKMVELDIEEKDLSTQSIKSEITHKRAKHSFAVYSKLYLDNLEKSKKFNQLSADRPRVDRFTEFIKSDDIDFKQINISLLKNFQAHLKDTRNIGRRTIVNHLVVIRSIFNLAKQDHPALEKYYPFGKGKIQIKFPETKKIGLTSTELKQVEELELDPDSSLHHTRNVWLFAFYFAGMRIADVLKLTWNDLRDNRLHYAMSKNDKVGSLKIPNKALAILDQYRPKTGQKKSNFVFPELHKADRQDEQDIHRKVKTAVKHLNTDLKEIAKRTKIDKSLTNHIARHTFGNISGDQISPQMLQKLYRHTSLTTTIGYQANFIYKDADEALDAVLGK